MQWTDVTPVSVSFPIDHWTEASLNSEFAHPCSSCARLTFERHEVDIQRWEVYRFMLSDREDFNLTYTRYRNLIIERVQDMLIG